jgi:hypothetical protein
MKCKICAGIDDTSIICEDCGETFYMCELDNPKDKCGLVEKSEAKAKELEAQLATLEAKVRADILKALPSKETIYCIVLKHIDNDIEFKSNEETGGVDVRNEGFASAMVAVEIQALCEKAVKGGKA